MMTIDEAIEILSDYVYEDKPCAVGDYDEATRLGIEALKDYLESSSYSIGILLPGETRETEEILND